MSPERAAALVASVALDGTVESFDALLEDDSVDAVAICFVFERSAVFFAASLA